jgi:hypothetical protein
MGLLGPFAGLRSGGSLENLGIHDLLHSPGLVRRLKPAFESYIRNTRKRFKRNIGNWSTPFFAKRPRRSRT